MAGVTDFAFRARAVENGAPWVVTEMVACAGLVEGEAEASRRLAQDGALGVPMVVQLVGRSAVDLAEGARRAIDADAAVIDINMGCPSKRVVSGACGAALMQEPDLAARLVEAVVRAAGAVPVSVKMRLGWHEGELSAPALARRLESVGAAAFAIHGRTRAQFYKGTADWTRVAAVVDAVRVPVLVNGDVASARDANAALAASGAAGVMIGRAAVARPWLAGGLAQSVSSEPLAPTLQEIGEALLRQHDRSLTHHGSLVGGRMFRKHLAAAFDHLETTGIEACPHARSRALRSDDPAQVAASISEVWMTSQPRRARAA